MRYVVMALLGAAVLAEATPPGWMVQLVDELEWMEGALLEATYFCALGVMAPALVDQHILAQRVVNILEGGGGPHFDPRLAGEEELPGVIPRLQALAQWLAQEDLPPGERELLRFHFTNVSVFLSLSLEAALRGARVRSLIPGTMSMRTAYAFLLAALGPEEDELAYLGGIRPLLSRYRPLVEADAGS
ncbi:MAG TPA: hypothetical protein ENI38_03475 [Candidatus Acetothermia bacterium]|nr:hypothetical protein [Candidatus Acetothermia bacterium]